jgi:hypothetical protein
LLTVKLKPVETVEVPIKMRMLARDRRGYPIPFIVTRDLTKRPFFTINDVGRVIICGRRKVCGICGQKLERDTWLIGGPGAAFHEHGAYLDPPMHKACATYALQVCPYLGARYTGRIDAALAKTGVWEPDRRILAEEHMIPEQPPFFVLARTAAAPLELRDNQTPYFHPVRPWLTVELWHDGLQIDDATARERLAANDKWPWTPKELPFWPQD